MSTNAYADWGAEAYDVFVPGADLTDFVGHAVYLVSDELQLLSATSQANTQTIYGAGVLLEGAPDEVGAQCRVITAGRVRAIAGTGGVTAGDNVAPEYAASGVQRGRFIQRSTAEFSDADVEWGTAMTTASNGGEFLLELRRRRVQIYVAP
jgi:hypothetical protein